jgi:hypothetical protein
MMSIRSKLAPLCAVVAASAASVPAQNSGILYPRPVFRTGNGACAIYGIRGGSDAGLKVFRPQSLPDFVSAQACGGTGVGGFGEEVTGLSVVQVTTHQELADDPNSCAIGEGCPGVAGARQLYNNQADLFTFTTPSLRLEHALAIATGFVNAKPKLSTDDCAWASLTGLPMLVMYKVTRTGDPAFAGQAISPPKLWRIALGSGPGNAFCVQTQSYQSSQGDTKIYAFVGEGTGRLIIFDISELQTDPVATPAYLDHNRIIIPACPDIVFPKDPYDGVAANVTDLALDKDTNLLYCGLGRAGIGIVDVHDALHPSLLRILDTPGLALGVTIRKHPNGDKTLVVGDSRCGIRIYQ